MKTKIILCFALATINCVLAQTVSRVTVGLGMGGNYMFENLYEYSLSTDGNHSLKIEKASRTHLVISPVVVFRLAKFETDEGKFKSTEGSELAWDALQRFSILLSANLLDLKSDNPGFNKYIDGGFGFGYAFSPDIQIGLFYETQHFRQLRSSIANTYDGLPIPNGDDEFYNALDSSDNDLFRDKVLQSVSIKLIFNITSLNSNSPD